MCKVLGLDLGLRLSLGFGCKVKGRFRAWI